VQLVATSSMGSELTAVLDPAMSLKAQDASAEMAAPEAIPGKNKTGEDSSQLIYGMKCRRPLVMCVPQASWAGDGQAVNTACTADSERCMTCALQVPCIDVLMMSWRLWMHWQLPPSPEQLFAAEAPIYTASDEGTQAPVRFAGC